MVKLNTGGSAIDNPGRIGAEGIIRDHRGNIIYAFATPLGVGTSNQAEIRAAIFGITWCIQHGYSRVILEVDSELLTKWLNTLFNLLGTSKRICSTFKILFPLWKVSNLTILTGKLTLLQTFYQSIVTNWMLLYISTINITYQRRRKDTRCLTRLVCQVLGGKS